jgi:hypothetical protein
MVVAALRGRSAGAVNRRIKRRHSLLFHVTVNILQHNNGVSTTTPTISVSESMVIWFMVYFMIAMREKVEMMDTGIAMAAIKVVRQLARKKKSTRAASKLPSKR